MQHYYNFTASENQISFDPYWYDKSNLFLNFFLGIIILVLGIAASHINDFKIGFLLSILVSAILFLNGIYRWKIKNKTIFLFDKTDDAFYKITPLGKKKIINLSNITGIISKSGSWNFNYILTAQNKTSIKKLYLTNDIKNENQSNPEIRFLEMEIIPKLESFFNLNNEAIIVFDTENCSPI
ncbi:hypothetical protein L1276_003988 [Flavobacterium sp. HSC-32F16]|uniref:hypothetical protein n=1 Tax=Flavobacterium sp. HSC-32F16 TaxID=2910964 RepID=UPI0020A411AF|nr:hypothetical protein [Flavobacterium sp. HSC-32F16]MCP2028817.1 hypothetical protein [Flavobacterium sp. HSC-32F16]